MALSQIQKKILAEMVENPDDILKKIQDNKINLDSFKNEFFQDGRGFMHILLDSYTYDPEKFKNLLSYVLSHSNLSLEDFKGRTQSAIGELLTSEKEKPLSHQNLRTLNFIMQNHHDKLSEDIFNKAMSYLVHPEYSDTFNSLLDKKETFKNDYYLSKTIEDIIIQDDLKTLKKIIAKIDKIDLECIQARTLKSNSHFIEASNLLILAIKHSTDISHFFLDNYNFDLSGRVKEASSYYKRYNYTYSYNDKIQHSSLSALAQSYYSANKEIFIRVLNEDLNPLITPIEAKRVNNYRNTLLEVITSEKNDFYNIIKGKILNIKEFKSDDILHTMLVSNIPLEDKLEFTQHIVENCKKIHKNKILNNFFNHIYKNDIKDIDIIGKIFSTINKSKNLANEFNELDIFKVPLINNSKLLKNLIANGYQLSDGTNNPFSHYFKLTEKMNQNYLADFYKSLDKKELNKTFDTIKLVYPSEILIDYNNANILQNSLEKLDIDLIKNLTKKEILLFKDKEKLLNSFSKPYEEFRTNYTNICQYLYDNDINFSSDITNLYRIFSFCDNYELIDNILEKENLNIKELSRDDIFWLYINHKEISDYVTSRGAIYGNKDITKELMTAEKEVFELYINSGGNVDIQESNNIIHQLIKQGSYDKASIVIKKHPHLTQEVNEQNKIPLSYFFNDFNKLCRDNHARSQNGQTYQFKSAVELFHTYIDYGKFSQNNKSKIFLLEQIEKYSDIRKVVPDIETIMFYKNLDTKIEEKQNTTKRMKI